MSVCQLQVNAPTTIDGVNLLPATYAGDKHTALSSGDMDGEVVAYQLRLPAESSGDGTSGSVHTLDVTPWVKSGAITVID